MKKLVEVQPTFPQNPVKITQENKESKMTSITDNDIVSLNFRYHSTEDKNIIFTIEDNMKYFAKTVRLFSAEDIYKEDRVFFLL
ncbi:unnamed protein product [Rhizophagus irregularis]|nr:unnamed protein product [Rhizophagus irregularis]